MKIPQKSIKEQPPSIKMDNEHDEAVPEEETHMANKYKKDAEPHWYSRKWVKIAIDTNQSKA